MFQFLPETRIIHYGGKVICIEQNRTNSTFDFGYWKKITID